MSAEYERLAERLRAAYDGGPVAPLRDGLMPDDINGAYAVQTINTKHWVALGRRIVGRKIGLTSESVQRQFGVTQPDFGVIFGDTLIGDGEMLSQKTLQPRVEAEIALVLGRDLFQNEPSFYDVLAATDYVLPALEVVDSRIADWKITLADTVADNASSAYVVLGRQAHAVSGLDLWSCGMVMEINGRVVSTGVGAACLGHPLHSAAWLARALRTRDEPLRAGDLILTGALGPMVPLPGRAHVRATIGGVGTVSLTVGAHG
jgi:2-keto-4-pentenoate hydratase